jgi:site-specific DNA-methyltransferase (adenine-specific)
MEIQPYARNAKIHPKAQLEHLARIVRRVGWRQPIVVNQDGRIIVGHGRWATYQAYPDLGEPWVIDDMGQTVMGGPATSPLTEDDEQAYRIADNKVHEGGKWDMEILIPLLKEIAPPSFAITGFRESIRMETTAADDYVPMTPTDPKTKPGDLYQLGRHKLYCADSTDPQALNTLMAGQQADMVFTDPPYNVDYKGKGKNTSKGMQNDHMDDQVFLEFLNDTFKAMKPHVKTGGGCVCVPLA